MSESRNRSAREVNAGVHLATKGLLKAVINADQSGDFPRGTAWLSLVEMIATRESEQSEGVDKDALVAFLGALGVRSRHSSGGRASFSPPQMEEIFTAVTGATIMEDERNILLRLPGLGAAQDNALNRSFIDDDLMNVCSSFPIFKYIQHPYSDYSKLYNFQAISEPMSDVGIESLSTLILRSKVPSGVIIAAIDKSIQDECNQMSFDIFQSGVYTNELNKELNLSGISVNEIDFTTTFSECGPMVFSNCLINKIILPQPEETNKNIKFNNCLVGRIEGRVSVGDLDHMQFIDCDIGEFTDEYSVNSEVLDTSLPLGVRVLLVSLKKIFTQGGTSRLESALYRGLDQRSKMMVPDVIDILTRNGFIIKGGRRGKVTYSGARNKRQEALQIIQTPNATKSPVLKEAYRLA